MYERINYKKKSNNKTKQGLTMQPKLASNLQSSCLNLLRAKITGVYHHAWQSRDTFKGSFPYKVRGEKSDISGPGLHLQSGWANGLNSSL